MRAQNHIPFHCGRLYKEGLCGSSFLGHDVQISTLLWTTPPWCTLWSNSSRNLPPNTEVRQKVLLGEEEAVQLLCRISVTTITKSLAALCTWSANLNLILKFGFWELGILEWIWRYQIVFLWCVFLFCLIGLAIGWTGFSFAF